MRVLALPNQDGWKRKLIEMNIPNHYIDSLIPILNISSNFYRSILLTGSWAIGESNKNSDFDILILVENMKKKNEVEDHLKRIYPSERKDIPYVDIKILAKTEITDGLDDYDCFIMWLQLKIGVILIGENPEGWLIFGLDQAKRIASKMLDNLNNSFAWLESEARFTGAALKIMDALKTFYFIERYLLLGGEHEYSKNEFIREMFDNCYQLVAKTYHNARFRTRGKKGIRVYSKLDRNFSSKDYNELLSRAPLIIKYMERIYHQLGLIP